VNMLHYATAHEFVEVCRQLPCGCLLKRRNSFAEEFGPATDDMIAKGIAVLNYWFHHSAARHECGLVSEGNPNGLHSAISTEATHAH